MKQRYRLGGFVHIKTSKAVIIIILIGMLSLTGCSLFSLTDPLDGTSWLLDEMAGSSSLNGSTITLQFTDGQAGGSSGCNYYGGNYEVKGDKLEIDEMNVTEMACLDAGLMDREQVYLGYFSSAEKFELSDDQLKITTTDGVELVFVPE